MTQREREAAAGGLPEEVGPQLYFEKAEIHRLAGK